MALAQDIANMQQQLDDLQDFITDDVCDDQVSAEMTQRLQALQTDVNNLSRSGQAAKIQKCADGLQKSCAAARNLKAACENGTDKEKAQAGLQLVAQVSAVAGPYGAGLGALCGVASLTMDLCWDDAAGGPFKAMLEAIQTMLNEAVNRINSHTDKKFRELFALMNQNLGDSIKGQCELIVSDLAVIQNLQPAQQLALLPSLVQTTNVAAVQIAGSFPQVITHMQNIEANFVSEKKYSPGYVPGHLAGHHRPDCTKHQQALDVFLEVSQAIIGMFDLVEFQLVMHNDDHALLMRQRRTRFRDSARQCLTDVDTALTPWQNDRRIAHDKVEAAYAKHKNFHKIVDMFFREVTTTLFHDCQAIGQLKLHAQQLRAQL